MVRCTRVYAGHNEVEIEPAELLAPRTTAAAAGPPSQAPRGRGSPGVRGPILVILKVQKQSDSNQ